MKINAKLGWQLQITVETAMRFFIHHPIDDKPGTGLLVSLKKCSTKYDQRFCSNQCNISENSVHTDKILKALKSKG